MPYPAVQSLKTYADSIINAPHYQPKLIAEFLKRRNYSFPQLDQWGWFLYNYITTPYEYWEISFLDLFAEARLFILCLFISNKPAYHHFLFDTFRSVSRFRQVSNPGYEGDAFYAAINEVKDTFIYIDKDLNGDELVYSFSTTIIVDFLLNYLQKHDYFIESLIKGAIAFDQLFFAFTTKKNDYPIDEDSGEEEFGQKILLSKPLQKVFIDKIINEFDELKEEKVDMVKWNDGDLIIQKRNRLGRDNKGRKGCHKITNWPDRRNNFIIFIFRPITDRYLSSTKKPLMQ